MSELTQQITGAPRNMYKPVLTTVGLSGLCGHLMQGFEPLPYRKGDKLPLAECGVCKGKKYFCFDPDKKKFVQITRDGYLKIQKLQNEN